MKRSLRIALCKENPYDLIKVLAPFQPFCYDEILEKLNLPILLVLARQREKSQKQFELSAI